jgi:catechol 2,3-dioxygenase-like lactoylglutathione lyase family enzyme
MDVPARLTVLTLGARDLPRLRRFYRGLGWQEQPASTDDWAVFSLGPTWLALYPIDRLGAEAAPDDAGPPAPVWNGVTLAINVAAPQEVDDVHRAAVDAGATPIAPPADRPYGPRASYVADPEGNRWEIVWAPGTSIGPDGRLEGLGG